MKTHVFKVPDRDLQVLVTIYDDQRATIAFRPGYGSWGPPIQSMTDQHPEGSPARAAAGLAEAVSKPLPDTAADAFVQVQREATERGRPL